VYDTRKGRRKAVSEGDEDELTSLAVCKSGKKVVTGTQEGWLQLFSWGNFADFSDRCGAHRLLLLWRTHSLA
jgi:hypothetical protein